MAYRFNIPPVTRALLVTLVFQSVLSAAIRYRQWSENAHIIIPYLNLVPQLSIVFPWTFISSTLVEGNIFTVAVAAVTLHYGGRYLERAWSSKELAKFMVLIALVPNLLTFCALFVLFAITRNEDWTLTVIGGTVSVQISFLVAFSQLVPAHTVTLFRGVLSLRVSRFPLVYLGIVTALSLTPLLSSAAFLLAIFGFLTSWTYLRFYKTVFPDLEGSPSGSHSGAGATMRGDASETFAFAEFFPNPIKPLVAALADQIFEVLVAMRLCTPFSAADLSVARGDTGSFMQRGTPGSARAEAERRRAVALKALDQRLHAATSHTPGRGAGAGAFGSSASNASPSTSQQPSGPAVETQPQPSTQTAMTSQPGPMLGETKFEPDDHDNHDGSRQG